jgi:triacylglycerol lipase
MSTPFSAGAIKDQAPHTPLAPEAAKFYARFIDVAYDMFQCDPQDRHPPQPSTFPSGYHLSAWIVMSDFAIFREKIKKFYGFIATEDDDPYSHIIAMRGTEGWWEWYDDAIFYPRMFHPVPSAGRVHYGFYRIYHTMQVVRAPHEPSAAPTPVAPGQTFADQVEQLVPEIPNLAAPEPLSETTRRHHFVVTGHSLGAALCTLYVMEHAIRKKSEPEGGRERRVVIERVCTFGSPRVGMHAFTQRYRNLPIDSWRIMNADDLVPKVPPRFPVPFLHTDDSYVFSSEGIVAPGFKPSCWHSMRTYEHWLDPSVPLTAACAATTPESHARPTSSQTTPTSSSSPP